VAYDCNIISKKDQKKKKTAGERKAVPSKNYFPRKQEPV
jgi:hypothetical protein